MLTFDSNCMTHANFHNYIVVRYDVFLSCIMASNRRRFDAKLKHTSSIFRRFKSFQSNKHDNKNVIIQVYTTLKDKVSLNHLK